MISKLDTLKVKITSETQMNQDFIDAWHRAEHDEITVPEESLCFLEPDAFALLLSENRLALLRTLRSEKLINIKALSNLIHKNYADVYQDIQLLKGLGLVQQKKSQKVYVPWDKIQAEINLAA